MSELWNVEEIVIQAQQGDEAAFAKLVKKYERLVYYIAIQKMSSDIDAMDIVQETFIEVEKSIKNLKEPRLFKAWLNRIVFSKIYRYYEKRKDRVMDDSEMRNMQKLQEHRIYMNPEKYARYQSNKEILNLCIKKLKPIYQDVLILQYFEEFSIAEIAVILDIPEGTVKSRINVAKKNLRLILEGFEKEEGVKLEFNSIGLEAFLLQAFAQGYDQLTISLPKTKVNSNQLMKRFHTNPLLAPVISATILTGSVVGIYGAYSLYENWKQPSKVNDNIKHQTSQETKLPFPPVKYQGVTIISARNAYQVLYDAAFTSKPSDRQELKEVYDTLKAYGGSYASMADYIFEYIEL